MTTDAAPASRNERALRKEALIEATVDRVWDAWTTRDGIVGFLAPDAEIDARVDGAFHIFFDPEAAEGSKGADTMRYLALQTNRLLSFDWNAPPHLAVVRQQRTVVVLRFEARDERTRITLHHVGWGDVDGVDGVEWDAAFRYFDHAWDLVLGQLQERLAPGGRPRDWAAWLARLRASRADPV